MRVWMVHVVRGGHVEGCGVQLQIVAGSAGSLVEIVLDDRPSVLFGSMLHAPGAKRVLGIVERS